ncbi:MAG: hypothetical protein DWQ02_17355, partial [Bacteroidetes bacterium]
TKKETTYHFLEDLRKWLRGDSRRADEQRLEKAAMTDPFLADAMDGFRQFPESDHEAAIGRLRKRLNDKTSDRKGRFMLWRVAAAVVFIIVAGGVFWLVNDRFALENNDMAFEPVPAQTEQVDTKKSGTESETSDNETTADLILDEEKPAKPVPDAGRDRPVVEEVMVADADDPGPIAEMRKESVAPPPPTIVIDGVPVDAPKPAEGAIVVLADEIAEEETPVKDSAAFTWADMEAEFPSDTLNVVLPEERQYIIGTILAEDNQPIIGVNVSALGTTLTTMTNIRGQFKLEWTPDIEKLEFLYNGYEKTLADVQGPGTLSVTMTQLADLELSDVTLTAESVPAEAKAKRSFVAQTKVQPEGGFDAFEKYIKKNKNLPANVSKGEVLLQFVVQLDGSLTNVKALQSVPTSIESEAIRLLTEGPKWENPSGKPEVVEYVMKF